MTAYLRFVVNPNDEEAFKRIINQPRRGIGLTSVGKILEVAHKTGKPLSQVLGNAVGYVGSRLGQKIAMFYTMMEGFSAQLSARNAYEIALDLVKTSGLLRFYFEDKTVEGVGRYENLNEMLSALKDFVAHAVQEGTAPELGVFLQEVALLTSQDQAEEEVEHVKLMTIHMSKGLEFDHVYIVGIESGLFPIDYEDNIEEERRLFYVATTRARKKLHLSYALQRNVHGKTKYNSPSIFLKEISPNLVDQQGFDGVNTAHRPFSNQFSRYKSKVWSKTPAVDRVDRVDRVDKGEESKGKKSKANDNDKLKEGIKVKHRVFGKGVVLQINRSEVSPKAIINFDGVGKKTLLLTYAVLTILPD